MRHANLLRDQIATGSTDTRFVRGQVQPGARLIWRKSNVDYNMPKVGNRANASCDVYEEAARPASAKLQKL